MTKALIVYFSATGVTRKIAERLGKAISTEVREIVPETPYTKADLDWRDKKSRTTVEMNDPNCRPAIKGRFEDLDDFDTIFLGFPIWWYREPSIIDTFVESYDLSRKHIVLFSTSGGSGMGEISSIVSKLAKCDNVEDGTRFSSEESENVLKVWASEFL